MKLNKLYINKDTQVEFNPGFNIILAKNHTNTTDKPKRTSDTNGVGKTTIINLIKKILGGDTENLLDNPFFETNKIWAFLEVTFDNNKTVVLSSCFYGKLKDYKIIYHTKFVELQKQFIEKSVLSQLTNPFEINEKLKDMFEIEILDKKDFKRAINKLEGIDYSKSGISFSSLLDFIIRDEKVGYTDIISRIRRSQAVQYRSIQYLFGLPHNLEFEASAKQNVIVDFRNIIDSKRKYLREKGIKNIDNIENALLKLEKRLAKTKEDKAVIRTSISIEGCRIKYKSVRQELISLNRDINKFEVQIANYKLNQDDLKSKALQINDLIDAKGFYEDILGYFPNKLAVNYQEYKNFIESISKDRSDYFNESIRTLTNELKVLREKKTHTNSNLNKLANQLSTIEVLDDYSTISAKEEEINNSIREMENAKIFLQEIENFSDDLESNESERKQLIKNGKGIEKKERTTRRKIIQLFQEMVEFVYITPDCNLSFNYVDDLSSSITGRTEIECSIPSDASYGRTNSKICLFDFTWFVNDKNNGYVSSFLIHDGPHSKISEEVRNNIFKYAVQFCEEKNKQYIITANENEIPKIDLDSYEKYYCAILDGSLTEGKFFKEQF